MEHQIITKIWKNVKEKRPLVESITNYVTVNDCANILLSFGASPAMIETGNEAADFTKLSEALYLNLGTLTTGQKEAMRVAASTASQLGIPVVLDPVAAGALQSRTDFALELLENYKISILKGNLGEIKTLAGFDGGIRGVDSTDSGENAIEACKLLAQKYNTVVAATGQTDIVSDGTQVCLIKNGHPMLTLVTGSGCMIGALAAATAAVEPDYFMAATAAVALMGIAGDLAAAKLGVNLGPGTFRSKLFDNVYRITELDLEKVANLTWL